MGFHGCRGSGLYIVDIGLEYASIMGMSGRIRQTRAVGSTVGFRDIGHTQRLGPQKILTREIVSRLRLSGIGLKVL